MFVRLPISCGCCGAAKNEKSDAGGAAFRRATRTVQSDTAASNFPPSYSEPNWLGGQRFLVSIGAGRSKIHRRETDGNHRAEGFGPPPA